MRDLFYGVLAISISACATNSAYAQTVKVTVDLSKQINILTSTSIGVPAVMSDGNAFNPDSGQYLKAAGITTVRFPGGSVSADLYHWSTNKVAPWKGGDAGYRAPESNFGNIATLADKMGTALVVVNYGSNQDGTGGAEPAEAAAWVAYANGDPSSAAVIGKDSTGHDWQTVGYWATIRTQGPLSTDDGFNFLRISRPSPIGIKMWQIGNQVYNNGYYGGEHVGEPDLHGPAPNAAKDFGKLRKNAGLSPATYGAKISDFAKAMKAVDPKVQIGASFVTPPDQLSWAPDWNSTILKKSCKDIDFISLEWLVGNTMPPDWHTLDEANMLDGVRSQLNNIITAVLYDYKTSCPKDHTPRIAFAPAGVITWPKVEHPVAEALWAADTYALLVESGSENVSWPEMYSDLMISGDRKKFGPVYSGLQMFHIIANAPGATLVDASSSNPRLAVHAGRWRSGQTGVMLVNKDSSAPMTVKVNIAGGTVGAKAFKFDYGVAQQKAGTQLVRSDFTAGNEFTVTVPAYSITAVLIGN